MRGASLFNGAMRELRSLSLALILLGCAQCLHAGSEERPLSLRDCIEIAIEHNLEIKIQRYAPQISSFALETARSAYIPVLETFGRREETMREGGLDPVTGEPFAASETDTAEFGAGLRGVFPIGLSYEFTPVVQHRIGGTSAGLPYDFYEGVAGVTLRQPLLRNLLIDFKRQNILLARKDVRISELMLKQQTIDVIFRVEQAYTELLFAREQIAVSDKAVQLAEPLLDEMRKRVEAGGLSRLSDKQAESEVDLRRADLAAARRDYQEQQNILKNLLSDNPRQWHAIEIIPTDKLIHIPERFDVTENWNRGLTNRPDILQARLDLEKRDIVARYQRNQLLPSLDVVGSYGHDAFARNFGSVVEGLHDGRSPTYSYGVIFSVPLSNRGVRNAYRGAKASREQGAAIVARLEQDALFQIQDAVQEAESSLERIEHTRRARRNAELAVEAEEKKLANGRSTAFIVLRVQRDLIRAAIDEVRAMADYNRAVSLIAFAEGSTLEKNQVSIR